MSFKARRLFAAALVISLLIQMQFAENGYASRGTKIAFTCFRDENFDICVMDGDGGNEVRLTDDPAKDHELHDAKDHEPHDAKDHEPSWSPDGGRIAFNRNHHIYVMDSDGRNLIELTGASGGSEPTWSPNGTKIAFTRFKALKKQIWVMDADGGNPVQLTQWGRNYNPAWSADSNRIAFVTRDRHAGREIYAMDSDGGNQLRLTHDSEENDNPSWSPDGQWIAFDSYRNKVYHIYVVKTDGSGRTSRLTRRRQDHLQPAWSPDGGTIAYTIREPGGFRTINLMARNGRHLKQLTKPHFYSADPDWFDPAAWSVSPATNFATIWGEIKRPPTARR